MAHYTIYDPTTGAVLRYGSAPESQIAQQVRAGEALLHIEGRASTYVSAGALVSLPPQPSGTHAFDWITKQWFDARSLDEIKAAKWTRLKADRTVAESAGFEFEGMTFDSNAVSQSRIQGAVLMAQSDQNFTVNWTLADNTVATLGQAQMIGVGVALAAHVSSVFAHSQGLRAELDAASTVAEVEALRW